MRRIGDGVPQRRVPGFVTLRRRGFAAGPAGHSSVLRQLHLVRNVSWHHESEPFTCLRRDEHRVAEFDLLLFELGAK
jgi:hypothetical protein